MSGEPKNCLTQPNEKPVYVFVWKHLDSGWVASSAGPTPGAQVTFVQVSSTRGRWTPFKDGQKKKKKL